MSDVNEVIARETAKAQSIAKQKRSRKEAKIEKYISKRALRLVKRAAWNDGTGYDFIAIQRIYMYGWHAGIQTDRDLLKEVADRTFADLGIPLQLKAGAEEYYGSYMYGTSLVSPFYYLVFIKA